MLFKKNILLLFSVSKIYLIYIKSKINIYLYIIYVYNIYINLYMYFLADITKCYSLLNTASFYKLFPNWFTKLDPSSNLQVSLLNCLNRCFNSHCWYSVSQGELITSPHPVAHIPFTNKVSSILPATQVRNLGDCPRHGSPSVNLTNPFLKE